MMNNRLTLILFLSGFAGLAGDAYAGEFSLLSQPAKCVSLKQGNICYQDIHMVWQAPQAGDFCLYNQAESEAMKCWEGVDRGEYNFEFSFAESQHYALRAKQQQTDLASSSIEVKWVYRARRNHFSWRVF
jgi:hypothetical protein